MDDSAASVWMCPLHRISRFAPGDELAYTTIYVVEGPTMIMSGRVCLVPDGNDAACGVLLTEIACHWLPGALFDLSLHLTSLPFSSFSS